MNEVIKNVLLWILGVFVIAFALLLVLFFVRLSSEAYIDDVSPGIPCEDKLLAKSDVLFIVPRFEGKNISEDRMWCAKILALNKTLAMHGVYHTYNEFGTDRSYAYVQMGAEDFKKCFGFYPDKFKAPQLVLSGYNKKMMEKKYVIYGRFNQLTHKTYHCDDSGKLPNWVQTLI